MSCELAVLIPAYNEEPRIGSVLEVVCAYSRKPRIVVIDDGSVDETKKTAGEFPVEVISFPKNRGKGAALQAGLEHVGEADCWVFLDADLINLQKGHIEALIKPIEEEPDTAMTVGVFRGGRNATDLAHRYFGILNGQRGLSRSFAASLPNMSWSRFGVEILLSKFAERNGHLVSNPYLEGLTHFTKEHKFGVARGFPYRLQMYRECMYSLLRWDRHV